jgi:CubicO group peptidase (beta-lactamase class C family)
MNKEWSRRDFLRQSGLAALAAGADQPAAPFGALVDFVEQAVKANTIPGAGLMFSRHGKTLLERYWGTYCGREKRGLPFDGSVFNIFYSTSKLITSTVVVLAKQDGLVEYDTPVSRYVPEFTGGGREAVTLRHCLTLSSGLPNLHFDSVLTEAEWKAALKMVCGTTPRWPPGSRSEYRNITGHFLAAECVRRRSGMKPWGAISRERLFDPLGAGSLTFELPPAGAAFALSPQPRSLPSNRPGFPNFSPGHPAGGCIGKLGDLMKVLQLHLQRGQWDGKAIMQPAIFKEMHTVQYAQEIAQAQREGKKPAHKSWGLGVLLRGSGPPDQGYRDYGFDGRNAPGVFGQEGIHTVMAVADPTLDAAVVFVVTDSPNPMGKTDDLRNGVTKRAFEAVVG